MPHGRIDEQDKRIMEILGTDDLDVNQNLLEKYRDYPNVTAAAFEAPDARNVEPAVRGALPPADLAHFTKLDPEEHRELPFLLVNKLLRMDQDQGVHLPLGDHVDAYERLANARRSHEHPGVVSKECIGGR